jgi:hypothetical protein
MLTPEQQHRELKELMKDMAGWGACIFMEPPGDVCFVTLIVPRLRGVEVVCASAANDYDIWRHGQMIRSRMTRPQVAQWITDRLPPESEIESHALEWTQATLDLYGAPRPYGPVLIR